MQLSTFVFAIYSAITYRNPTIRHWMKEKNLYQHREPDDPTPSISVRPLPILRNIKTIIAVLVTGRKYRRLLCASLLTLIGLGLLLALAGLTYFDQQHNNIIHEYVARQDDIAILSATFYNRSRSFPNNTVVILLNAHQVFHLKHAELYGYSTNITGKTKVTFKLQPVVAILPYYCKWVPFIAIGQVSEGMTSLKLRQGDVAMKLPIRMPFPEKRNVVACFSPLFLNERWQLLLLTAEVYSHYGASMHFYVRSMISDLFSILSKYPKARVQPWPAIQLGADRASPQEFDPNVELEFRNQAAAMTDCLLLYKESAQYIIFPDTDDVIIPRLAKTYFEEFNQVFNTFPEAAAVAYNMSQASIRSSTSPRTYSPSSVLRSVKFKGETRWGKIIVKPERVDSVWIHKSYGIREGYEQIALPIETNSALHLRFWSFSLEPKNIKRRAASYDPLLQNITAEPLIAEKDLAKIHGRFRKRMKSVLETYEKLPEISIYYPLIEQCYNRIFYNGQIHSKCSGPELCELPQFPGVRCQNTHSTFETFTHYENIYIHRLNSVRFEESDLGCTM